MIIDKSDKNFKIDPKDLPYGENLLDDWSEWCPDWATQCNAVKRKDDGGSDEETDHED